MNKNILNAMYGVLIGLVVWDLFLRDAANNFLGGLKSGGGGGSSGGSGNSDRNLSVSRAV